jgi:hypothetical protein
MRNNKRMAFLAFTVVAVAAVIGLRPAPEAMATGSCSTFNPVPSVMGPCPVSSTNPSGCEDSGPYTAVRYSFTGASLDHIAAVVTANNVDKVLYPPSSQIYGPGVGDPVTGLGKLSQHELAIKGNSYQVVNKAIWIVVDGTKTPVQQSIVAKKGFCTKSFAVPGLGLDLPPAAPVTQTLTHCTNPADPSTCCSVEFTLDQVGGSALKAKFTQESLEINHCTSPGMADDGTIVGQPIGKLELLLDTGGPSPESLGPVNYGIAELNSGTGSCTTKIIGGKVYTYGKPCP